MRAADDYAYIAQRMRKQDTPIEDAAPLNVFKVMFGHGDYCLNDDAKDVIRKAVLATKQGQTMTLHGHRDASEFSVAHLSAYRMSSVWTYICRDIGLAASRVTKVDHEANDPHYRTPPHLQEPANRRVEITIT